MHFDLPARLLQFRVLESDPNTVVVGGHVVPRSASLHILHELDVEIIRIVTAAEARCTEPPLPGIRILVSGPAPLLNLDLPPAGIAKARDGLPSDLSISTGDEVLRSLADQWMPESVERCAQKRASPADRSTVR